MHNILYMQNDWNLLWSPRTHAFRNKETHVRDFCLVAVDTFCCSASCHKDKLVNKKGTHTNSANCKQKV